MDGILNRRVEGFVAVAREGSISRAAQVLGVSQPALSQALQSLETSTGLKLLNRTRRGTELTAEGKLLFDAVEKADRDICHALDLAARSCSALTVGTNCQACGVVCTEVGPLFHAKHPEFSLTVRDLPGNDTLAEGIAAGCDLVEAAYSNKYPYPQGTVFHHMLDAEIILCVPPEDDLAALGRPLEISDLDSRTICLYHRGVLDAIDQFIDIIEASGANIHLKFSNDCEYSSVDYLVNGWIAPSLSIFSERRHPMVPVRMAHPHTMSIGLFSMGELSPAARLFLETADERFGGDSLRRRQANLG